MTDDSKREFSEQVGERVRIYQRGEKWYANYQMNGRQCRESLKTTKKKAAIIKAHEIDRKLALGEPLARVETATIAEAIEAYRKFLTAERRRPKTMEKYNLILDRVATLAQQMNRLSLAELNLFFVDRYRSDRAKVCQPRTLYTETVIIRQLVKFAFSREMISKDPLQKLKIKKPKPTRQPYFTVDQLEQIHRLARPPHNATFLLLAETGLRIGEAKWLTWSDVDFAKGWVHVRAKDGWQPKTGDERAVPLTSRLRTCLLSRRKPKGWVLNALPNSLYPSTDRQINQHRALKALKRVLKQIGIEGKLHSFRHSFISRSLTNGVEEAVVREWVGHVDPNVIRLYTHIADDVSQDRIKRLDHSKSNTPPATEAS